MGGKTSKNTEALTSTQVILQVSENLLISLSRKGAALKKGYHVQRASAETPEETRRRLTAMGELSDLEATKLARGKCKLTLQTITVPHDIWCSVCRTTRGY